MCAIVLAGEFEPIFVEERNAIVVVDTVGESAGRWKEFHWKPLPFASSCAVEAHAVCASMARLNDDHVYRAYAIIPQVVTFSQYRALGKCSHVSWERGHLAPVDATRASRPRSQARVFPQV